MGGVVKEQNRTWQKAEANAIQTKSGGGFDTFLELNARPLARGRYRIQWNAEARLLSGSVSIPKIRCRLDGNQIGINVWKLPDQEWQGWSGWDIEFFAAGAEPVIDLQVRRMGGTNVVEMRRLKLSIELMDQA